MTTAWVDLIDSLREDQTQSLENICVAIAEAMATSKPVLVMIPETKRTISLYMSFKKKEDIKPAAINCISILMDMAANSPSSNSEH